MLGKTHGPGHREHVPLLGDERAAHELPARPDLRQPGRGGSGRPRGCGPGGVRGGRGERADRRQPALALLRRLRGHRGLRHRSHGRLRGGHRRGRRVRGGAETEEKAVILVLGPEVVELRPQVSPPLPTRPVAYMLVILLYEAKIF